MKILDPGHLYELDNLDAPGPSLQTATLRFVKRVGDKYPGNSEPAYEGTTTQEVLRALIDRQKYVDGQRHDMANVLVVSNLRQALRWLEVRAAEERGDDVAADAVLDMKEPELEPTCAGCGHVLCARSHEPVATTETEPTP